MYLIQLKYFLTVARCEHMTHAAEELHIAQPSLSKVISKLEDELGVPLFERVGRQIKLNHFGRAFLYRVERIFSELENGKLELAEMLKNESLNITIAANNIGSFSKILEGYLKISPNTVFKQTMGPTEKMKKQLQDGAVDFCITSPPIEDDFIECIPLTVEEIFLVVSKKHKFATYKAINLIEAAHEPFICLKEGFGIRDLTEKLCRQAGFNPIIVFETDIATNLIEMVNSNMGVALLPRLQWNGVQPDLSVSIPIKVPVCSRVIALSFIKDHYLSSNSIRFKEYLIDFLK
ncbi:LysR family transcriptional regulator [Fusibacter ferrireducens]|uniref:LysR family transcriptional regulator n=1 Tax=Fusibacter ferrireducens TaxID=2785058 RepID=A0ABR9ZW12_9FIRM|nr:LysR family transcriptional regulator [Fusibacter ferrireducens]MBF4694536.1 LysR family transcriptional regulator [Fusibacter ferrireducens]